MSRWSVICGVLVICATGCAGKTSSLLLERHAIGPLSDVPGIAQPVAWQLEPASQTQEQGKVEVSVTFASKEYLTRFFSDKRIFKGFAGLNPYYPENLVFYVNVANRSDKRILFNPADVVLLDDRGNQYVPLNVDYVTALEEYRQPMQTTTRKVLEDVRPGYFGLSLPIGKMVASKPQHRFALVKQSSLQAGFLYPGVVQDGLITFWSPARAAKTLRLLVANIKTDLNADDVPQMALEFPFTFQVLNQ